MTVLSKVNEFNLDYDLSKNLECVCEIKNQVLILCITYFDRLNEHLF
jgi:hypothetical protein